MADPMLVQNHLRSMQIGQIPQRPEIPSPIGAGRDVAPADGPSFKDVIAEEIGKVNAQMVRADRAIEDLATGRSTDVQGTVIELQKANLSFRMLVEVRNKAIRAYEEIMRMQA